MTVEVQTDKVRYEGDGATTSFSFSPMVIFASTDLVVTKVDTDNTETVLTEGTGTSNYSVSVSTYPGTGTITYPATLGTELAADEFIVIKRVLTLEQTTDLENQGGYFPDTQETQFDKLLMIDMQQQEEIDRAVKLPITFNEDPTIPEPEASKFLKRNSSNNGFEWASSSTTTTGSASDSTPQNVSLSAGAAGSGDDYARDDHVHLLPTVTVAKGGTGATTAAGARTNLSAQEDVITTKGDVLVGNASGAAARKAVGADGTFLKADSGQSDGLAWGTISTAAMPRSYLAGLGISNNATDAAHDIDIAVGECWDNTNSDGLTLASALTKRIDAAWAVGTGNGGMDTGSVANSTWYHVHLIKRSDTAVVDALFSTSAASPTMPTNYDRSRRIGSVLTDGSANIIAFSQSGDDFLWDDPPLDINVSNQGTSAVSRTLTVPDGIQTHALINLYVSHGSSETLVYISSLEANDEAPSVSAAPLATLVARSINATVAGMANIKVRTGPVSTGEEQQVRSRSNQTSTTLRMATLGWVDRRGRDD